MNLHEPVTLLTDCLLAALAGWLGWRLRARGAMDKPAVRWWSHGLLLTALSALVGGLYHGLGPNFPAFAKPWWILTLWLICLASATMGLSLSHELVGANQGAGWRLLVIAKLVVFAAAVVVQPRFFVAIIDYGIILLAWAIAAVAGARAWRGWMLAGVGACIVGALVQQMAWSLSPHFNHNDLYHVIQGLALYAFYRAALLFGSGPPSQRSK